MTRPILIADDDPVMIKLLEFHLRQHGFRVIACRTGDAVLPLAREQQPTLAIIDYLLPGRNGLELLQDFRGDPDFAKLPLIVVTGQGRDSTREALLAAGACRVFTKPFSPTILMESIRTMIEGAPS